MELIDLELENHITSKQSVIAQEILKNLKGKNSQDCKVALKLALKSLCLNSIIQ